MSASVATNSNLRHRHTSKQNQDEEEESSQNEEQKSQQPPSLSLWDFVDLSKPWVLVKDGSMGGYFDWVPKHFRVGPWSIVAVVYLTALYYLAALAGIYLWSTRQNWVKAVNAIATNQQHYPNIGSMGFYYHTFACAWMLYVMYLVIQGPAGIKAWATFTVQSWTLLMTRHALAATASLHPILLYLAEFTRFPAACSVSVTFVVWNFMLFPFFLLRRSKEDRKTFVQFAFSFRLVQLHVFNIIFAFCNVYLFSPPRQLLPHDMYVAVVSMLTYMAFYLFILDRCGVHIYPIFTPRVPALVAASWTIMTALYFGIYFFWRYLLQPTFITTINTTPGGAPSTLEIMRDTYSYDNNNVNSNIGDNVLPPSMPLAEEVEEAGVWLSTKSTMQIISELLLIGNSTLCKLLNCTKYTS